MEALNAKPTNDSLSLSRTEVSFDPANRKQVEEAKTLYRQAKLNKRVIRVADKEAANFRDCAFGNFVIEAEGFGDTEVMALHIFDKTGDRRIMWRPDRPKEVKEAAKLFQEYIGKGWKAYAIHRVDPHRRGVRVYEFDSELEEVVFDDQTIEQQVKLPEIAASSRDVVKRQTLKEKLASFAGKFDEIKMVPKTMPG